MVGRFLLGDQVRFDIELKLRQMQHFRHKEHLLDQTCKLIKWTFSAMSTAFLRIAGNSLCTSDASKVAPRPSHYLFPNPHPLPIYMDGSPAAIHSAYKYVSLQNCRGEYMSKKSETVSCNLGCLETVCPKLSYCHIPKQSIPEFWKGLWFLW